MGAEDEDVASPVLTTDSTAVLCRTYSGNGGSCCSQESCQPLFGSHLCPTSKSVQLKSARPLQLRNKTIPLLANCVFPCRVADPHYVVTESLKYERTHVVSKQKGRLPDNQCCERWNYNQTVSPKTKEETWHFFQQRPRKTLGTFSTKDQGRHLALFPKKTQEATGQDLEKTKEDTWQYTRKTQDETGQENKKIKEESDYRVRIATHPAWGLSTILLTVSLILTFRLTKEKTKTLILQQQMDDRQVTNLNNPVNDLKPLRMDEVHIWTRMGNPTLDTNRALAEKFKTCGCPTFSVHNKCLKTTRNGRIKIVVDSGATRSVVPWSVIENLEPEYVVGHDQSPFRANYDASGNKMPMIDKTYDIKLTLKENEDITLTLVGACVMDYAKGNRANNQILLGMADWFSPNYINIETFADKDGKDRCNVRFNGKVAMYTEQAIRKTSSQQVYTTEGGLTVCFYDTYEYEQVNEQTDEPHKMKIPDEELTKDPLERIKQERDNTRNLELQDIEEQFELELTRDNEINPDPLLCTKMKLVQTNLEDIKGKFQFQPARKRLTRINKHMFEFDEWNTLFYRKFAQDIHLQLNDEEVVKHFDMMAQVGDSTAYQGMTKYYMDRWVPNSYQHTLWQIENIRRANLTTFTYKDIVIDPSGEVLKDDPLAGEKRQTMWDIILAHKKIFRKDVGCVQINGWYASAEINESICNVNDNRVNYQKSMTPEKKELVVEKLNKELADGVLGICHVDKVPIKNVIPIFGVEKKADPIISSGEVNPELKGIKAIRMIADCKIKLNKYTVTKARGCDDQHESIQKIAQATANGLIGSVDISEAFHAMRLDPKHYPYFVVDHPILGPCYYRRLAQGWISSPDFCREFLMLILGKFNRQLARYADDILFGAANWEQYVRLLKELFATLEYADLRMKGKKVTLLSYEVEFLGRLLSRGTIKASPHQINIIQTFDTKMINTNRMLKRFVGTCGFIGPHKKNMTEIMHKLREVMNKGTNKDFVKWTPELIEAFENAKKEMLKLTTLHAFDPKLETHLYVDTSDIATGAYMIQIGPDGKFRFVGLFSRRRSDKNRKTKVPSCLLELSGIAAAVTHFRPFIEEMETKLIIFTDSLSAVRAAKRYSQTGEATSHMRFTSFLAAMYGVNYQLEYLMSSNMAIDLADMISRKNHAIKECDVSECKICQAAENISEVPLQSFNTMVMKEMNKISYEPGFNHSLLVGTVEQFNKGLVSLRNLVPEQDNCNEWKLQTVQIIPREKMEEAVSNSVRIHMANMSSQKRLRYVNFKGTIFDLMQNRMVIRSWQESDPTYRLSIEILEERNRRDSPGMMAPNSNDRVKTILNNHRARLNKHGHLMREVYIGASLCKQIYIPTNFANQVIECVHATYGHSTTAQLVKLTQAHFHIEGLRDKCSAYVKRCIDCMDLAKGNRRMPCQGAVPIPDFIGQQILVDEIHRQNNGRNGVESVRFLFATDALSKFCKLYPLGQNKTNSPRVIPNQRTSKGYTHAEFIDLLLQIRHDFGADLSTQMDQTLHIRADKSSIHIKAANSPKLKSHKIKLQFHNKSRTESNQLPELDGRVAAISGYLRQLLQNPNKTLIEVAREAATMYNTKRGKDNLTPSQIWLSRNPGTHEQILVNVKSLQDVIRRTREVDRVAHDKSIGAVLPPMCNFVPFSAEFNDYNSEEYKPLKKGDLITVFAQWDKNKLSRFLEIDPRPNQDDPIDWENRIIRVVKIGVRRRRPHNFGFRAIKDVVDGDSEQAKLYKAQLKRTPEEPVEDDLDDEGNLNLPFPVDHQPMTMEETHRIEFEILNSIVDEDDDNRYDQFITPSQAEKHKVHSTPETQKLHNTIFTEQVLNRHLERRIQDPIFDTVPKTMDFIYEPCTQITAENLNFLDKYATQEDHSSNNKADGR